MSSGSVDRRAFLRRLGVVGAAAAAPGLACAPGLAQTAGGPASAADPDGGTAHGVRRGADPASPGSPRGPRPDPVKPPRLSEGDTVGLVNPSGATYLTEDVVIVEERLAALGLQTRRGEHVLGRHGYLAGTDRERAADINLMFADPSIDAIVAVRGGWGAARILPLLDFDAVRAHPKIFLGYSDITALLLGFHALTGLVTFHGPVGSSRWNEFSLESLREILFEGGAPTLSNPTDVGDDLTQTRDRVRTITSGRARGRLLGGNLSVLSGIVGSEYLPDWEGAILFLEEVGERIYRVDRMLTQLALAGILDAVDGVVFGKCSDCDPGGGYGSLTLEQVFEDHFGGRDIPAWEGAMIGHAGEQWTLPVGVEAEIDADAGTIDLLEPAVR